MGDSKIDLKNRIDMCGLHLAQERGKKLVILKVATNFQVPVLVGGWGVG